MRKLVVILFSLLAAAVAVARDAPGNKGASNLRPIGAFARIKNADARAEALFTEAGKVLLSPRCLNCHPAGERPTQHESMTLHEPKVVRGPDGLGATAMRCTTCHGEKNYDVSRTPGDTQWRLAPAEMAWQGKSLREICEQLKDKSRNGGKSEQELIRHSKEDSLVGWGWAPGAGRAPAPGTQAQFAALIEAWLQSGGACPR